MMSRFKEEERNEKAISNLLKLPENRRFINCNSLLNFQLCYCLCFEYYCTRSPFIQNFATNIPNISHVFC
ncbi:hypothetical protein HanXRQr2_Chr07g0293421 [Helianthus annuus]|uniref:Uncharacterized protein n=1 Tax=Helianthus annuus TaxID=4232 RepID=A0A9K3IKF2_HELAN|nr:hypothetical protein HanXRQr2_Chr07g0293421 [Helianthus annuus]KAJ0731149.1 hypothetical protein HanOQP8_Chr07g0248651 [Helianthus annuus]